MTKMSFTPKLFLLKQIHMNENLKEHSMGNEYNSVNHQLRSLTKNYLESHPNLTLNALSTRSGIAATTLRRLMQEDQRSEIAPHAVLALTSYLYKETRLSKLLQMIDGPIADLLNKSFDKFIFDDANVDHQLNNDLNDLLRDKILYLIYKMCANSHGSTLQEIKDAFGLHGLKKCDFLISKGVIFLNLTTNRLHAKIKNFTLDLALAHELSHVLIDQYKPEDVNMGKNLFYSLSEGMTDEGIAKIKEIKKMAIKKVFDVMSNADYQGTIPYFSLFISDCIGPTPVSNNQSNAGVLQ